MKNSTLQNCHANSEFGLKESLKHISNDVQSEVPWFMAVHHYRVLGITSLLLECDDRLCAANWFNAGQARRAFLTKVESGWTVRPKYKCSSKNIGFSAALAAGAIDLAQAIASLSPQAHIDEVEYEEDFLFFHFLHRFVLDSLNQDSLQNIIDRWQQVLKGRLSGYLDACIGLLSADSEEFADGFSSLIDYRQNQLEKYLEQPTHDEELYSAEGKVFIEGLAVLRLAEMVGIITEKAYPLIPAPAIIPHGIEFPGPDGWQSLE